MVLHSLLEKKKSQFLCLKLLGKAFPHTTRSKRLQHGHNRQVSFIFLITPTQTENFNVTRTTNQKSLKKNNNANPQQITKTEI